MAINVEAALVEILRRVESGASVTTEWLNGHYGAASNELQEALVVASILRSTREVPERIGRYRIGERIGTGGMGVVYRAERVDSGGAPVAAKVLHPHLASGPGALDHLRREAEIGKRIRHPNVVSTLGFEVAQAGHETYACILMELVEGETLRERLARSGPLAADECLRVGRDVASALAAVHAAGTTHRDVKPANVMLGHDGRVRLMDLGVAVGVVPTDSGFAGTFAFAAPEQLHERGVIDGRTDLYALGLTLQHAMDDAEALTDSGYLSEVVEALLAARPQDRIQTANELVAILADGPKAPAWIRRRRSACIVPATLDTPFVGRGPELETLMRRFRRAQDEQGSAILIEGDAGMGKSRLLAEFERALRHSGAEFEFLLVSHAPGDAHWRGSATSAAFSSRFGRGATRVGEAELPGRLAILARRLAKRSPAVLCVEDLHFASDSERSLVADLARDLRSDRVLIIMTTRPDGGDSERLVLQPLPRATLAAIAANGSWPTQALERIMECAEGNPHFLIESLRAWRERGVGASDEFDLPESVMEILTNRLKRLPRAEHEFLQVAACSGTAFDTLLVGDALGLPVADSNRLGSELVARGFVRRRAGRLEFDHHRVVELVRSRIAPPARAQIHGRLADFLGRRLSSRPALEERLDLCRHLIDAGRVEEATLQFQQLLELVEPGPYDAALLLLFERTLDPSVRHHHRLRAELLYRSAAFLRNAGRPSEGRRAIHEALGLLPEGDADPLRVQLLNRLAVCELALGNTDELLRAAEAGLELDAVRSNPAIHSNLLRNVGLAKLGAGDAIAALPVFQEAVDVARAAGLRPTEAFALCDLASLEIHHARPLQAIRIYQRVVALARSSRGHHQFDLKVFGSAHVGVCLLDRGEVDRAKEALRWAMALAERSGSHEARAASSMVMANAYRHEGRYAEAIPILEQSLAMTRRMEFLWGWSAALGGLIQVRLDLGQFDLVAELVKELGLVADRLGTPDGQSTSLRLQAAILDLQRDWVDARDRLDAAVDLAERSTNVPTTLAARLARGRHLARAGDLAALRDLSYCEERGHELPPISVLATIYAAEVDPARSRDADEQLTRFGSHLPHADRLEALLLTNRIADARRLLAQSVRTSPKSARRSLLRDHPVNAHIRARRRST